MKLRRQVIAVLTIPFVISFIILFIYFIKQNVESRNKRLKFLESRPMRCRNPMSDRNSSTILFESESFREIPNEDRMKATVSFFASKDFIPALEVFLFSFNLTSSKYPLLLAVPTVSCLDDTSDASLSIRNEEYLIYVMQSILSKYPDLPYRIYSWPSIKSPLRTNPRWRVNYSKLRLWEMTEYEKLFYVDLDVVFMDNFDEVFDFEVSNHYLGSYDYGKHSGISSKKMNGGVFLTVPSIHIYDDLLQFMFDNPTGYRVFEAEQGLFNTYFNQSSHCCLPSHYNTQKSVSRYIPELWNISNIKILHYVGEKPWKSWTSMKNREYYISSTNLREYLKKDSWDAHEYEGLHDIWKIMYFLARKNEMQQLTVYILPSYQEEFPKSDDTIEVIKDEHDVSTQPNSKDIPEDKNIQLNKIKYTLDQVTNEWKLYFQFIFRRIYYLTDINRSLTFPLDVFTMSSSPYRLLLSTNRKHQYFSSQSFVLDYDVKNDSVSVYNKMNGLLTTYSTSSECTGAECYSRDSTHNEKVTLSRPVDLLSVPSNEVSPLAIYLRQRRLHSSENKDHSFSSSFSENEVEINTSQMFLPQGNPVKSKFIALIDIDDISKNDDVNIDWTKIHLHRGQIFYWRRQQYKDFYAETDYSYRSGNVNDVTFSQFRNAYTDRIMESDTTTKLPLFWQILKSHINFPLPEMSKRTESSESFVYYPSSMTNFIISAKLFEKFKNDLNDVITSILSSCKKSDNGEHQYSTEYSNFDSQTHDKYDQLCICTQDQHEKFPLTRKMLRSMTQFTTSSASNYVDGEIRQSSSNIIDPNDTEIIKCFRHVFKVYWLIWLKYRGIEMIYAVDPLFENRR